MIGSSDDPGKRTLSMDVPRLTKKKTGLSSTSEEGGGSRTGVLKTSP